MVPTDAACAFRRAPAITYGYSKDHRPDLKQLLFILTTDADDGVPVQFRCADGNTTDVRTHIETWNTLRALAGRADFLYVADSKLCSQDNMDHIARAGGRFVTVMPRSRQEDAQFRKWMQSASPAWELVWDRPNARCADAPTTLRLSSERPQRSLSQAGPRPRPGRSVA